MFGVHIAKDKLIEPGKAIFQILISWRQGFSLTIFYTFRYRLSSIVVILDYQFQGSVSSVIAMVPIIKQIPKRRCEEINSSSQENKTFRFTIFRGRELPWPYFMFFRPYFSSLSESCPTLNSKARWMSFSQLFYTIHKFNRLRRTYFGTVGKYKYYLLGPTSRTSGRN